ncbi:acyl carrier protein [Amycolatopsis sp., V23-08]|uniref:Acyl carrier protein n=1 Tax=Amycolatopsis heterodermiae TaxID=3110235 RepID=A0ABU5R5H7_9PSEU|nr:acyl carrier protein [Amycolatopsis sp., V23-08]MEA5360940.1 acyl carrier protein [Amycolatopsis sp., V23-08]
MPSEPMDHRLFDCVQVNLAKLADRRHGDGTHLALGRVLRFWPRPGVDGLPTVEPRVDGHVAESAALLGLRVTRRQRITTAGELEPGPGCYVVADAYHLPWVPYFGRKHLEHSFLVEPAEDGVTIVDGYHNDTEWGAARPGRWTLGHAEFAEALPEGALTFDLAAGDPPTERTPLVELADADTFVATYADHPDRVRALRGLTLQTWLLTRSRRLHAAALGLDTDAVWAHLAEWDALAKQVYLSGRRVAAGREEPRALFPRLCECLAADHTAFGGTIEIAAKSTVDVVDVPVAVRDSVTAVIGTVLGAEPPSDARTLGEIPGFSSFRMMEIVERIESDLGVEFAPEDLVPEKLTHVDGLCRAVLDAGGTR